MKSENDLTIAMPQVRVWPRVKIGGFAGYAAIWAFFGLFLIYPLIRLFYDAFTTDRGTLTLINFYDFFTDSFYLHCLVNSLLLGAGTVITTSILGIFIAFLLLRYEFPGRNLFSFLTIIPMIMPPLVGVMGFVFILGRAGTVNVLLMDYLGFDKTRQFHVRRSWGPACGNASPLSSDDPEHRRCHGKDFTLPRRSRRERGVAGAPEVLGYHLSP